MLSSQGLYSDMDGPMTGLLFIGQDIDPERDDVKGRIIQDLSDAFGMWGEGEAFKEELANSVKLLMDNMAAENKYARYVLHRYDEQGSHARIVAASAY